MNADDYRKQQDLVFQEIADQEDEALFARLRAVAAATVDKSQMELEIRALYIVTKDQFLKAGDPPDVARANARSYLTRALDDGRVTLIRDEDGIEVLRVDEDPRSD